MKTFYILDNILATLVVIMVLSFLSVIFSIDFLNPVDNLIQGLDATNIVFSQIRDYDSYKKDTNIVLVNIGQLPRKGIADEINIISSYNPKVIGIDAFFRTPKGPEQDEPLMNAFAQVKNLVLVTKLTNPNTETEEFDSLETSNSMFTQYTKGGFANLITNDKNEFRTVKTFSPQEKIKYKTYIFFALQVVRFFDSVKTKKFLDRNHSPEMINFRRNYDKYITLDVNDIFEKQDELGFLKDKIVLMGFMGPDLKTLVQEDVFFTPMNQRYIGKTYPDMYGVVVHANIISMVLDEEYMNTLPHWIKNAVTILIIFLNLTLFRFFITKYERWYEPISIITTIVELSLLFVLMLFSLIFLNFEIGFGQATLFGVLFSATGFEIYHGSFKPIAIEYYNKTKNKINAKREKTRESEKITNGDE